jgi:hypothetical protein
MQALSQLSYSPKSVAARLYARPYRLSRKVIRRKAQS